MAYHDIDNANTNFVITHRDDPQYKKFFHLAVDKRPAEELYHIKEDPGCINNLANQSAYSDTLRTMRSQMGAYLMATNDPRVTGNGDVFETYERLRGPMREFPEPEWVQSLPLSTHLSSP